MVSTEDRRSRAWVEVDLANLLANARAVQHNVPTAKLLPMVKADAYGLGARPVVRALEGVDPWGYGVATVAEGADLREAGVTRPIVVFTPVRPTQFDDCRHYDLRPVLDSPSCIERWDGAYHLEIDTGMGRAGIPWRDTERIARACQRLPEGLFTHFHSADSSPASVEEQLRRLRTVVASLPVRPPLIHAANSAGSWRLHEPLDLVRPGIFLYGGGAGVDLPRPAPVAALRARVVSLRRLATGDTVSYGATWSASRETVVATLSIGYADGILRAVAQKASVSIGGMRRPIVGRVTMDMIMVDLGPDGAGAAPVAVGDAATVIGGDGAAEITLDEFAGWAGTISYEVLVGLGRRLPRIYEGP